MVDVFAIQIVETHHVSMLLIESHHSVICASDGAIIASLLVVVNVRIVSFGADLLLQLASHFFKLLLVENLDVLNLL